ncbi:quinone-interacting membrane-bound oxidoreductase complex subunit QmoC [Prosthecochloris sp. SCSIO W1101]|uniref:quinone-interacting membrane-bound oxidoreductase complex subunit QmoC n=1 Tax=Prosthecochloris sp. SCSIO W1101 TaxID=2992242 RepID=UPI00223DD564|nr:quinone-interacting membrane-bound oxidoreductase complex subunit QmoC [Prosthecochloris sp. SCSIO W1101]UZJ42039.1 quinone-interacting membrane-bound oxidoreductase complex subunit QmoC [Prosthecochloris sp. SCSIO W1101]
MAEKTVFTPDVTFVRELREAGADTMKKCYQCATCSVVCQLSPDDKPFPRKEMLMAQWGLKDELVKSADIWLCHNCNDCSKYCPRGARPGDVLAILRKSVIQENAFPKFMGKIVGDPKNIWQALAIPVVFFLLVLAVTGHLYIPKGEVVYSKFFPVHYIDQIFVPLSGLAVLMFAISITRFWKNLGGSSQMKPKAGFLPSFIETLKEIMTHSKFKKCDENQDRSIAHMLVFYGFIGLFITTLCAILFLYGLKWESPYRVDDPDILALFGGSETMVWILKVTFKLLANVSSLALLAGGGLIIANRLKERGADTVTSSFDWVFAGMVLLVGASGMLAQMFRVMNFPPVIAYLTYFLHLVFVFYIIIYVPYSKLAHFVYRTVAITYTKMLKRDIEV